MFGSYFTRLLRSLFVATKFTGAALLLGLLVLSGCRDESSGGAAIPSLQSIEITPTNPGLAAGTSMQLTATAIYSDNSHADVTTQVAWSSSNPVIATAGASTGKTLAISAGSVTLSARLQGHNASTTLMVTAATLVSIAITPPTPSIALGTTQQLTATGTYTDNSTQNLSAQVTWASATASVATISNAAGSNGLATSVAAGTSGITASMGGITSAPVSLTVSPATLVSIAVTSIRPKIALGIARQLTATGSYTDNSTQDLTNTVTWLSNTPSILSISNASGSQGQASGVATGPASVSASVGTVTSPSLTLTVTIAQYAYVANESDNTVSQYSIGAGGALSAMTPAMVGTGSLPYSVTVDPTGRYAYVANQGDNTVSQYTIGAGGALSAMTPATVGTGAVPSSVTVDPTGRYAYVANESDNTVSQYTIGAGGALNPMTPATVGTGATPFTVTVDPTGRYAYVANQGANTVSQYTIGAGGALSAMTPATVRTGLLPFSVTTTD
jgi:DNA-binding beta-propeller fold protein YncE